jgi:hypothetical protein
MSQKIIRVFLSILFASHFLWAQQQTSKRIAPSQGNKQDTTVVVIDPQKSPFCNVSESDHAEQRRDLEAKNVPALLAPKVCSDQDNWDLASDPSMHSPFWTGQWSTDPAVWAGASKNPGACLAGKADIVLERSFKYGFCDANTKNVTQVDVPKATFSLDDADYYILNIVVWDSNGSHYSVVASRWYVYNHGDHGKWYRQPLSTFSDSLRVYESKKPIGFVAIHIRPSSAKWSDFRQLKVKYTITVKGKTAANVANFLAALELIGNTAGVASGKQDPDGFYGATFFKAKSPSDISFNATVDFPKTQSADNISSSIKLSAADRLMRPRPTELERDNVIASRLLSVAFPTAVSSSTPVVPLPQNKPDTTQPKPNNSSTNSPATQQQTQTGPSADCPVQSGGGQQPSCTFTATVDDEDLYHWDISFAVPFRTVNDLVFLNQTGGNTVVPKTVTRLNAYAFFQLFPIAADIKTPPTVGIPHLLVGLPISGKVFNKPLFGGGNTFNLRKLTKIVPLQVGFFGGVIFNKEFRQIPGTTGSSNVVPHRVWNGTYGVEIPVSQFKSLLPSNKTQNSTSSSQKSSSQPPK